MTPGKSPSFLFSFAPVWGVMTLTVWRLLELAHARAPQAVCSSLGFV
jgi:hypothetical protein